MTDPRGPRYVETTEHKIDRARGDRDRADREVSERYQKAVEEAQARFEQTVRPYREECRRREAEASKVLLDELEKLGDAYQQDLRDVTKVFLSAVQEAKAQA